MNKIIGVIVIIVLVFLLLVLLDFVAKEMLGYFPHEAIFNEVTDMKEEFLNEDNNSSSDNKTEGAILSKYKFKDYPENLTFHYYLGNDIEPKIEDSIEKNSEGKYLLTLKFTNIEKDSIYNGGDHFVNLYANNVKDKNIITVKKEKEVSTYKFLMKEKLNYKN